jgi:hypothetical protein
MGNDLDEEGSRGTVIHIFDRLLLIFIAVSVCLLAISFLNKGAQALGANLGVWPLGLRYALVVVPAGLLGLVLIQLGGFRLCDILPTIKNLRNMPAWWAGFAGSVIFAIILAILHPQTGLHMGDSFIALDALVLALGPVLASC